MIINPFCDFVKFVLRISLFFIFAFCIYSVSFSQNNYGYTIVMKEYLGTSRIQLENAGSFLTDSLVVTRDSVRFFDKHALELHRFNLNEIKSISRKSGNYLNVGLVVGGVTMGTLAIIKILRIPNPDNGAEPENGFEAFANGLGSVIYVGTVVFTFCAYTAGGLLAGWLMGTAFPKWDRFYRNNHPSLSLSFQGIPSADFHHLGITLCLKF